MNSNNIQPSAPTHGLTLTSTLLLIFVVLKLAGLVAWSWIWVLSPVWIELLLRFIAATLVMTVAAFRDR